jgi:membrane glycosyltransferase
MSEPRPAATDGHARVLEIPRERLLQDWKAAYDRACAYLETLSVPENERDALATRAVELALTGIAWRGDRGAVGEVVGAVQQLLLQTDAARACGPAPDRFLAYRLEVALSGEPLLRLPGSVPRSRLEAGRLASTPPVTRGTMTAHRLERHGLRRSITPSHGATRAPDAAELGRTEDARRAVRDRRRQLRWTGVAFRRRLLLSVLVLIPSVIASGFMVDVLPHQGGTWLELTIVLFFGTLFGWISIGFWTATLGFFTLIRRDDPFRITSVASAAGTEIDPAVRAAVIMPICEEPVDRVFAGMKAVYQSLERTGARERFDLFLLSDSGHADTFAREEEAWFDWCRAEGRFEGIYYRRRRVRVERKSGNVADFCRRWGQQYRYMIVLDADSLMAGEALVRLVEMMEAHPDVGMIQTAPTAINRRSLFARVQQFAARVYGPMFAAGLHFWQLGDGQYWGHNAIIRVAPFMAHCALPRLPGKPPLGGEILSHDFVEAALMGRAGWGLWLAFDLPGSYEETPPTLLEEMKRDRRWCQGNLQHLRLLVTKGLFAAHRALFLNGVLSYVSALLWFCFLSLSTAEALIEAVREPDYFPSGPSLFPQWPVWRPDWALWLVAVTAAILFLPKILSVLLILFKRRNARSFGGAFKLCQSVAVEILVSSLLAPIRMVFHTKFVLLNLLGRTVSWRSQQRGDSETSWREALHHHGLDTLFASVWGLGVYWLSPEYFWWLTPVVAALILSVPLSVYASRNSLGEWARKHGLFMIPEEISPPAELRDLAENLYTAQSRSEALPELERNGFVRAVVDPRVNAVHCAMLGSPRSLRPSIRAARRALLARALAHGPGVLAPADRRVLLSDPETASALHHEVWRIEDNARARLWGRPGWTGH